MALMMFGAAQAADQTSKSVLQAGSSGYLADILLGLLVVCALILALAWLLKKINGLQHAGLSGLKLAGGISLGGRERLLVVEVDGERLLLGVSPAGISKLMLLRAKKETDFSDELRKAGEQQK